MTNIEQKSARGDLTPTHETYREFHFSPDGNRVVYLYQFPGGTNRLEVTSLRPQLVPDVQFDDRSTGEWVLKADESMEVSTTGQIRLDLPTAQGQRKMFTFENGEIRLRNTREGLTPHLKLFPEIQQDGSYLYHSPTENKLNFTVVEENQEPPTVFWRPVSGNEAGEFFIQMGKEQELDAVTATSRTTVEMPIKRHDRESEREGPLMSVENGNFHVRVSSHHKTYVEAYGAVDMVEARGEAIGREAMVVIPEDSFVKDLYLRGHTYVQTHDTYVARRLLPLRGIGTVHVGNGRQHQFNNDRFHGYELGMQYDETQERYVSRAYSLQELQKIEENHDFDRNRSGHEHVIKRKRKKQKDTMPYSSMHEVEGPETLLEWATRKLQEEKKPYPPMHEEEGPEAVLEWATRKLQEEKKPYPVRHEVEGPETINEKAIRQLRRHLSHIEHANSLNTKFVGSIEPILTKKEQRRQEQLEAERAVTQYVALEGKPLRNEIKDIYDTGLWIQNSEYDVDLAYVLSLIKTRYDKERPFFMTSVLTPNALLYLRHTDSRKIQDMIGELMADREEKSVEAIASLKNKDLGLKILAAVEEGLAAKQKARLEKEDATPNRRWFSLFR